MSLCVRRMWLSRDRMRSNLCNSRLEWACCRIRTWCALRNLRSSFVKISSRPHWLLLSISCRNKTGCRSRRIQVQRRIGTTPPWSAEAQRAPIRTCAISMVRSLRKAVRRASKKTFKIHSKVSSYRISAKNYMKKSKSKKMPPRISCKKCLCRWN